MRRLLIILLIFSVFVPLINANDSISMNAGGGLNVIITSHELLEGFFSGEIPPVGPICGNGVLEAGEECDDGNTVSGDGCSSTCTIEVPEEPPGPSPGPGVVTPTISVSPTEFNINLAVNTNIEKIIKVTNLGTSPRIISISQQNLDQHVILETTSLTLAVGEAKDLKVTFVATSQTGIFTGKIIVGGKVVSVSINVRTMLTLFDSNIIVLNKDYEVPQGDKLRTQVTLIPMGEKERIDVTLNYVIKDYTGKTYLTRSETTMVEDQVEFKRNFDTGILPLGKYIVGLQLVYPNGVAPSSAHFEVIEKPPISIFGKIVFFLIILILIILILIVIILIQRRRKKNKQAVAVAP